MNLRGSESCLQIYRFHIPASPTTIAVGDGDATAPPICFMCHAASVSLFGQKLGCYLDKNESLQIIWAKVDIRKMNEIWLLPKWNLELYQFIVCLNIDFNEKFALRFRGGGS